MYMVLGKAITMFFNMHSHSVQFIASLPYWYAIPISLLYQIFIYRWICFLVFFILYDWSLYLACLNTMLYWLPFLKITFVIYNFTLFFFKVLATLGILFIHIKNSQKFSLNILLLWCSIIFFSGISSRSLSIFHLLQLLYYFFFFYLTDFSLLCSGI